MTLKKFNFNVIQKDDYSRCGLIETHRGNIKTPVFMPVGTQATVKAAFIDDIGLKEQLSQTRANGLVSMIKEIKLYALAYQNK